MSRSTELNRSVKPYSRRDSLRQIFVGSGVIAVAVGMGWGAWGIPSDAGYAGIGPNFLPWLVSVALLVCGGLLVYEALTGGFRDLDAPDDTPPFWSGFVWMSTAMLLNAALITTLGFIVSCTLCFVLASRGMRNAQARVDWSLRAWMTDGIVGLLIAAPVYWFFTQFLAINLPGLTTSGWL
jgi:putative tricarboxylic transport membrane protein